LQKSNDEHRSVLSAIADNDAERARRAMEAHISGTSQILIGLRHSGDPRR
jgi:DNA-binding GntR family transcriptional regulator